MRVLLALAAIALIAPVTAQHEHGAGPVQITTDLDGLALVGHPAHFNVIAFGDDDEPDFHQDLPVRVYNNGREIFSTDATSGHDYDGVQAFDVVFMEPGTWRVEAIQDGKAVAHRNGTVAAAQGDATLDLAVTTVAAPAGDDVIAVTLSVQQDGARVHHVDGLVEVFDPDGRLVFRTHTHTHEEDQVVRFAPDASGQYTVRATGYIAFPTEDGPRFAPVVAEETVSVTRGLPSGAPATTPPPQALNAVVRGETGPFQLIGTYDPWTQVGTHTIQRLTATVLDDGVPVPHVDFDAELVGPRGTVFLSQTLHEYDGSFELAVKQADLGLYELRVTASRGDWSDEIVMPYAVVPAGAGAKSGDQLFTMDADLQQDLLGQVTLEGRDAAGNPFSHGEIDLDLRADGLPLLLTKLHTHGDGTFRFHYAPPLNGTLELGLTPFPLEGGMITGYHGAAVGDPVPSALDVQPAEEPLLEEVAPEAKSPGLPVVFLILALVLARR